MSKFQRGHLGAAKLTLGKVLEIRERYARGETQGALSREYGVGIGQIGRIVRGEAWQQYDQPEHQDAQTHQTVMVELSEKRLEKLLESDAIPPLELPADEPPVDDPLVAILRSRGGEDPLARFRRQNPNPEPPLIYTGQLDGTETFTRTDEAPESPQEKNQ